MFLISPNILYVQYAKNRELDTMMTKKNTSFHSEFSLNPLSAELILLSDELYISG